MQRTLACTQRILPCALLLWRPCLLHCDGAAGPACTLEHLNQRPACRTSRHRADVFALPKHLYHRVHRLTCAAYVLVPIRQRPLLPFEKYYAIYLHIVQAFANEAELQSTNTRQSGQCWQPRARKRRGNSLCQHPHLVDVALQAALKDHVARQRLHLLLRQAQQQRELVHRDVSVHV